eukprot:8625097-Alexandrium_andersonii.AAC.1
MRQAKPGSTVGAPTLCQEMRVRLLRTTPKDHLLAGCSFSGAAHRVHDTPGQHVQDFSTREEHAQDITNVRGQ